METKQQHQQLKDDVKSMLLASAADPLESLKLIDTIQRLGVSYHFETGITEILGNLKNIVHESVDGFPIDDLNTVSLWFRLLRQEGFNISSGMFPLHINKIVQFFYMYTKRLMSSMCWVKQISSRDSQTKKGNSMIALLMMFKEC